MENGTHQMCSLSKETRSQEPIAGALEHLARTSQSQVNEQVSTETGAHLSERFFASWLKSQKKIAPNGLSTKMLKECLAAIEGGTLPQLSLKWENWGMISNGSCSTQKISEYHKTGSECILLDILESEVENKYFLSKDQTEKIMFSE